MISWIYYTIQKKWGGILCQENVVAHAILVEEIPVDADVEIIAVDSITVAVLETVVDSTIAEDLAIVDLELVEDFLYFGFFY